jgi:hypothetical protein
MSSQKSGDKEIKDTSYRGFFLGLGNIRNQVSQTQEDASPKIKKS